MLQSDRNLLKSRVNTFLGSLFLASWALACGLIIWQASTGQNPVANAFTKMLVAQTSDNF